MKRTLSIILISLIMLTLTACGITKPDHDMRPTEQYLYSKYDTLFTFDHYDNAMNYIFKDDNGQTFTLKYNGYYFSDNYQSIIHQNAIEKYLKENISGIASLKTSTEDTFTTQNFKTDNFKDYLKNGIDLNCTLFCDINDFNKEKFQKDCINATKDLKCRTTIRVEIKDKTQPIDTVLFRGMLIMTKNGNTDGWVWTKNTSEQIETTQPKEG